MADKNQNQYHPAEVNGYHRSDQESLEEIEEARRKKKMKWTIGIIAFIIFQVVQGLFFVLVIMKFKSPKFRVADFTIPTLTTEAQTSPSFNMSFVAPIRVKNTNWGPFKYDASTVNFIYGDVQVGQATIPKGKANFKSTKKIDVPVTLNSGALPTSSNLGSELTLKSQGELKGKVTVMFMFKKTKISKMNCTIEISTSAKEVKSLHCS
ncbi:late embryogenesis abundant protein At1g64065-like [Eucalyptus grandis]|uniref:late embryogenesis abundant protein At1g64065-like n=1 Tax=Eucalyptus grandis TaxID=71139 RepID=UPI00192EAFBD|nr:late embryogenesis abundant protein At1g64065-like [Eucalyptus grandis]